MKKVILVIVVLLLQYQSGFSQEAEQLLKKVKSKIDKVNDYIADGRMRTDIAFIKAPIGKVKVLFKKPNLFKLKRENGISILPKGGVSVNMASLLSANKYVIIPSGENTIDGKTVKVIKLLPTDENDDVALTTLYIDEAEQLIKKTVTNTKENGTFEMLMKYGNYAAYGLPDRVTFSFSTKDYKLPKGVTLEFETGDTPQQKLKNKKGKVEIVYNSYTINKGISDTEFK